MIKVLLTPNAFEDISYWKKNDWGKFNRIKFFMARPIERPYFITKKLIPLNNSLLNLWAWRIDQSQHKIVFSVNKYEMIIYSCMLHDKKQR